MSRNKYCKYLLVQKDIFAGAQSVFARQAKFNGNHLSSTFRVVWIDLEDSFFYNTYKLTNHQLIFKYLSSFLWYLTEYQRMIQIVYSRNQRSYRKCSCRLFLPITLGSYPRHKYLSSCFPCGPEAANIRWWKLWQDTSTVKTLGAKSSKLQAVV